MHAETCTALHCRPYDTMEEVIGLRGTQGHGSLLEWGVTYRELPLAEQGLIDWDALRTALTPRELWSPHSLPLLMRHLSAVSMSRNQYNPYQQLRFAARQHAYHLGCNAAPTWHSMAQRQLL